MTTLDLNTPFSFPIDFVQDDTETLAKHMFHCANSRSRFFELQSALQTMHTVVCSHVITVAALAVFGFTLLLLA